MKKKSNYYRYYSYKTLTSIIFLILIAVVFCKLIYDKYSLLNKDIPSIPDIIEEEPKEEVSSLSLIMVGDSLIHSAVYGDADTGNGYNFDKMFSNVSDYISSYDLEFYNQESILGGSEIGLSTYPRFNSPYEVGDAFRNMGFNLVSLANNHTLDRGVTAINNSRNYWNKYDNIIVNGSATSSDEQSDIKILEMNGITYTLLAYTDTTNGLSTNGRDYLVNIYDEDKVRSDIESIRDKVDLLIVSMHFGEEYRETPTDRQKSIALYLSSLGVDIVVGTHPHVVEPIEFIDKTMVIYSLGNFISAQRGVEKLTGLMASVNVVKKTFEGVSTISLENPAAELIYTASDSVGGYRKNFRLYRYQDLTNDILDNYQYYYDKFMNIVTSGNTDIEKR